MEVDYKIITRKIPKTPVHFADSFDQRLNIYDQAALHKNRSKVLVPIDHKKEKNEIAVGFSLDGELKGNITCLLNLDERKLGQANQNSTYSLFTECMNILLGNFLTNLEDTEDIMATISSPRFFGTSDQLPDYLGYNNTNKYHFEVNYKLASRGREFDCRIYFQANKRGAHEV